MKCFEKLVLQHIKDNIPASFDPHQYAFRTNRSTEDAISTALPSVCKHLEIENSYIRILFVDFSSACNTNSAMKATRKLNTVVIFYQGAIESILTGNMTKWHGSSRPRTALQQVIKTTQNITGTIDRASVTSVKWDVCTEPSDTKEYLNTHPATVCSPCCHLTTDTQESAAVPPD